MQDKDEQARIREAYAEHPGTGHLVEQAMGERENALAQDDDATVIRAEEQIRRLGWQTPQEREDAAVARKADAERRAREEQRVKENRGEAAARDDHAGGPEAQKPGASGPEAEELARRQPPARRRAPQDAQQAAQQPGQPGRT